MSSPTSSGEHPPAKRRKMSSAAYGNGDPNESRMNPNTNSHQNTLAAGNGSDQLMSNAPQTATVQQSSIPKRGARACTACRKGKNRCEGEVGSYPFFCWEGADGPLAASGPGSKEPCIRLLCWTSRVFKSSLYLILITPASAALWGIY